MSNNNVDNVIEVKELSESIVSTVPSGSTAPTVPPVLTTSEPDLSEELQKIRDSLPEDSLMYYNNIDGNEDKISYLKSIRADRMKNHKKGV
ncbi:hypothetical protein C1645_821973 [Glomus cerebriforme]|uniref:Uncharacterized protein n=1 Tax=Glomus cerebriforme TaxID=658196 RepID=A0A397SZH8_9GLOM|nr:hypothetical protein C1645_821973 [Glomus cerebriforme]